MESFQIHNEKHDNKADCLNAIKFTESKKWTQKFCEIIRSVTELRIKSLKFNRYIFCPLCSKIEKDFGEMNELLLILQEGNLYSSSKLPETKLFIRELITEHLSNHLHYFPLECMLCAEDGLSTEFCIGSSAREHLRYVHNIKNTENYQLEIDSYFVIIRPIAFPEQVIQKALYISEERARAANLHYYPLRIDKSVDE